VQKHTVKLVEEGARMIKFAYCYVSVTHSFHKHTFVTQKKSKLSH